QGRACKKRSHPATFHSGASLFSYSPAFATPRVAASGRSSPERNDGHARPPLLPRRVVETGHVRPASEVVADRGAEGAGARPVEDLDLGEPGHRGLVHEPHHDGEHLLDALPRSEERRAGKERGALMYAAHTTQ